MKSSPRKFLPTGLVDCWEIPSFSLPGISHQHPPRKFFRSLLPQEVPRAPHFRELLRSMFYSILELASRSASYTMLSIASTDLTLRKSRSALARARAQSADLDLSFSSISWHDRRAPGFGAFRRRGRRHDVRTGGAQVVARGPSSCTFFPPLLTTLDPFFRLSFFRVSLRHSQ